MPKKEFATGALPKFKKEVFDRLVSQLRSELQQMAVDKVRQTIKSSGAIASGEFYESVTASFDKQSVTNYVISVGSDDPAALPMEEGLKPTFVPIEVILKWMIDKGIGRSIEFAFYVQKKLSEEGYEPRRIFERSEEKIYKELDDKIDSVLNREDFIG